MTTKSDQEIKEQKESNDDKGDHDSHQNSEIKKVPNKEPENPLREQK